MDVIVTAGGKPSNPVCGDRVMTALHGTIDRHARRGGAAAQGPPQEGRAADPCRRATESGCATPTTASSRLSTPARPPAAKRTIPSPRPPGVFARAARRQRRACRDGPAWNNLPREGERVEALADSGLGVRRVSHLRPLRLFRPAQRREPDPANPVQLRLRAITQRDSSGMGASYHRGVSRQLRHRPARDRLSTTNSLSAAISKTTTTRPVPAISISGNGRFTVTPQFPGGTYAYFVTLDENARPAFPVHFGLSITAR